MTVILSGAPAKKFRPDSFRAGRARSRKPALSLPKGTPIVASSLN